MFESIDLSQFEMYFSIVKFRNNVGFSLTQNLNETAKASIPEEETKRADILRKGAIPEFI